MTSAAGSRNYSASCEHSQEPQRQPSRDPTRERNRRETSKRSPSPQPYRREALKRSPAPSTPRPAGAASARATRRNALRARWRRRRAEEHSPPPTIDCRRPFPGSATEWIAVAFWRKGDKDSDALRGLPSATQGERIEQQLLRGSERDLELEGDTRLRVERVVPGLGWDARVAEKIGNVRLAVDHVAVDKTCAPGVPKFGSSGPAVTRWALVMSTSACSAPKEPAPPIPCSQPVTCSSPVIVPSAKRSNSTQPQKPPSSGLPVSGFWQNDDAGLLQLPENADLPRIVAGTAAVGTSRRGKPRRQRRRSGKRRHQHKRTSHRSPLSRPRLPVGQSRS